MQKHPMYSVKEAAVALGCDERWVREQLNQGQLKGEKKSIGMKDKWFVYKGEVDQALARKGAPPATSPANQQFFGVEQTDSEPIDAEVESSSPSPATDNNSVADLVKVMANQFAEKLDQQKNLNIQLQREINEQGKQLRLLPDLQKKAEEANLKQFELEALKKQLEEVQILKEKAEADAAKAQQLEQNVLPELRQQVESERLSKEQALAELAEQLRVLEDKRQVAERDLNEERIRKNLELQKLQEKLSTLDEYKQTAEESARKIEELERVAADKQRDEDEKAKTLEELKRIQEEKDAQVAAMQEQVTELSQKLEKANKGFWRKFFLGNNA